MRTKWDTDRHNVSVNDGVVTYYCAYPVNGDGTIDLQSVAAEFAATYDHNDIPGPVSITVENLMTGEEMSYTFGPDEDDE